MGLFKKSYNYHISKDGHLRRCSASTPEKCHYKGIFHISHPKRYSEKELSSEIEDVHLVAKEKFQQLYDDERERQFQKLREIKAGKEHRRLVSRSLEEALEQLEQVNDINGEVLEIATELKLGNDFTAHISRNLEVLNEPPKVDLINLIDTYRGMEYNNTIKFTNVYVAAPAVMPVWRVNILHPILSSHSFSAPVNQGNYGDSFGFNLQLFFKKSEMDEESFHKTLAFINTVEEKLGNNYDYRASITNKTDPAHISPLYGDEPQWDIERPILAPLDYAKSNFTSNSFNKLLKSGDFNYVVPDFKISVKEEREDGVKWSIDREQEVKEGSPWSFTISDNNRKVNLPISPVLYGSLQDFGFSEEQAKKRGDYAIELSNGSESNLRKHAIDVEEDNVRDVEEEERRKHFKSYTETLAELFDKSFNESSSKKKPKYMDLL